MVCGSCVSVCLSLSCPLSVRDDLWQLRLCLSPSSVVCLSSIHYRSLIYRLPIVYVSVYYLSSVFMYHLFLTCVSVDRLSHCLSRVWKEAGVGRPLDTVEKQVSSAIRDPAPPVPP